MNVLRIIIFALITIFASCNYSEESSNEKNVNDADKLIVGSILEGAKCRLNPQYTYSYYLPTGYNTERQYPIIIIFDAHARAKFAISRFVDIAEKYNYILLVSENSRNGSEDINLIINSLWHEANTTFSIDEKRIYTAGFSGGAKVAISVAIYKGGVRGVVSCGAGMPNVNQELKNKFDFVGIAGIDDFNYQEIRALNVLLQGNGFNSSFISFNGGHEWAKSKVLEQAIRWFDIVNMKNTRENIDNQLLRDYAVSMSDSINELYKSGNLLGAYQRYTQFLKDFDGLYDVAEYTTNYQKLKNNTELIEAINKEQNIKNTEIREQVSILSHFKNLDYKQLQNKINLLKQNKFQNLHLNKRLLGFAGMLSYVYLNSAIQANNTQVYTNLMQIYELIDPNNPDVFYFKACKAIIENKTEQTLHYLHKAVSLGYYDVYKLKNTPHFKNLQNNSSFIEILEQIEANTI